MKRLPIVALLVKILLLAPNICSANFDFAMDSFKIDGNIFLSGNADGVVDFVDNFADGSLTASPTSRFFFLQPVEESGGFLRFRNADGARTAFRFGSAFLEDDANFRILLVNGLGNSEITASFRADTPDVRQFYGIGTVNSAPGLLESVAIGVRKASDGTMRVRINDHTGTTIATDRVTLPTGGLILLRLFVNDTTNQVIGSYSVDNGATFTRADQFSFFVRHGTIFNAPRTRSSLLRAAKSFQLFLRLLVLQVPPTDLD